MTKQIPLTRGKFAVVDDADFEWLNQWKWTFSGSHNNPHGYAQRIDRSGAKLKSRLMHRVIMNEPPGLQIDHINGDGLDNRRSNLRVATAAQNAHNQRSIVGSYSKYKGVSFYENRYYARIFVEDSNLYLKTTVLLQGFTILQQPNITGNTLG